MKIFSKNIDNLHVDMEAKIDLFLFIFEFQWIVESELLFAQTKASITNDVTLTLPNTNHPFFL